MALVKEQQVREYVALMRELGVSALTVDGVSITLGAAPIAATPMMPVGDDVTAEQKSCHCPHEDWQHDSVSGVCLEGCHPSKCLTDGE